jgi:hypothetical protein
MQCHSPSVSIPYRPLNFDILNEVTCKDAYPLPRVDDTLDELKDAIFTSILISRLASGKFDFVRRTSTRQHFKHVMVSWSGSLGRSDCVMRHLRFSE